MAAVGSQEALLAVQASNWTRSVSSGTKYRGPRPHCNYSRAWSSQAQIAPVISSQVGESSRRCNTHARRRDSGPMAGFPRCRRGEKEGLHKHKAVADNRSLVSVEEWEHETAVSVAPLQGYPLELEQVEDNGAANAVRANGASNGASASGSAANGAAAANGACKQRKSPTTIEEILETFELHEDRGGDGNGATTSAALVTASGRRRLRPMTTAVEGVGDVEQQEAVVTAREENGSLAASGFVDVADVDFARTLREIVERGVVDVREVPAVEREYVAVEGTCTFWQAMLNAVNILLGVGLLTIPYAMSQGGWSALGVLAFLGYVTNYTGKILGRCQASMCLSKGPSGEGILERGLRTYEDIGEAAFGEAGRTFITGILYTELVGTCGLFFILEGDNLATLFGGDPKFYMLASALVLLPTTWLPDLSALAALGALGAMASFSVLGVVLYSFISGGFPAGPDTTLLHLQTLPLTFGLLAFVYAGHAVFPNIQASMKEPELYPRMLDYTYVAVGAVCALVGAVGYQMFGSNAMEEITLNLPAGELTVIATSLIVINPFTKFALTMEPVAQGLEGLLRLRPSDAASVKEPKERALIHPPARVLARSALGASALFLATSVPFFGGMMALVGSSLTLSVSVIFPAAAYLSLFGRQMPLTERAWNYFIIVLGGFCAAVGTYTAFEALQSGSGARLL